MVLQVASGRRQPAVLGTSGRLGLEVGKQAEEMILEVDTASKL